MLFRSVQENNNLKPSWSARGEENRGWYGHQISGANALNKIAARLMVTMPQRMENFGTVDCRSRLMAPLL